MSNVNVRKRKGSAQDRRRRDNSTTEITTSQIPSEEIHPKWEKILNEEKRDIAALQIREEVFETVFQICYQKYLEKQVIEFTVHCAHQAFLKVARIFFIKLDPGEKLIKDNPSWLPDKEPEPSPMDAWMSHTVPVVQREAEEEPDVPRAPKPSPVTEPSSSATPSEELVAEEQPGGLDQQLYTRYRPSTEWSPAAVESVLRHASKPKPSPESPIKEEVPPSSDERPAAKSRKAKAAPQPSATVAQAGDTRRSRPSPIESKSMMKKSDAQQESAEAMGIPRPPVLQLSALPPSRVQVKCTVVPLGEEDADKTLSNVTQPSHKQGVRWTKSVLEAAYTKKLSTVKSGASLRSNKFLRSQSKT